METLLDQNVILFIAFLAAVFLVIGLYALGNEVGRKYYGKAEEYYREKFVHQLQFPDNFPMVFWGYLGGLICLLILSSYLTLWLWPFILGGAILIIPVYQSMQKVDRVKRIEKVLPGVLQQLAANTKNTASISLALQEVARTAPKPMDYELTLISRQEQELKSFTKAINSARERLDSKWFDIVASVLITADEKGGKTSDALENLAEVFVQLITMQNKIETATSQGRMSMKVMLVLPFFVVLLVGLFDPSLLTITIESTAGIVVLIIACIFYLVSLGLAVWLSKVKI